MRPPSRKKISEAFSIVSQIARKARRKWWRETYTPEQRSEIMRQMVNKRWSKLTPEQRSAQMKAVYRRALMRRTHRKAARS